MSLFRSKFCDVCRQLPLMVQVGEPLERTCPSCGNEFVFVITGSDNYWYLGHWKLIKR